MSSKPDLSKVSIDDILKNMYNPLPSQSKNKKNFIIPEIKKQGYISSLLSLLHKIQKKN